MSNLFYRNLQLLILTICLIVVWGLSSFFSLPRLEDPELTQRNAFITTVFPGASAERVEFLVTDKIEQELFEIKAIDTIESTSRLGFSTVSIQLKEQVKNVDQIWSRVRDKITDIAPQLPAGASTPKFEDSQPKANGMIVALTWEQDTPTNYAILRRWSQELEDRLRFVQGTEKVELFGTPQEEIVVEINPEQLSSLGITAQELSQQILRSDAKVAAGQLRGSNNNLLFEVNGELDSLERISSIPISFGNRSQFTRLGDIAQVKKGIVEPASELALINGRHAIAIAAMVESNQRLDEWAKAAHRTLAEFETQLPRGIGLDIIFNQNRYVEARLNQVISNLVLGAVLVVGVTLLIMGWKSALIVGSALPLSVLIVFGAMKIQGIPLHQMSVTGIIIALGLLIDNAIIVVDEVQSHLREGIAPHRAVTKTINHIAIPLLASTLTSVLAFLPIALAPGGTGEFTGTIGVTVILALLSSLALSLTVIPALVGKLHRWGNAPVIGSWWQTGFSHPRLTQTYGWVLDKIFARPVIGVVLTLILPISGFLVAPNLEQQFFPPTDREQFYIEFELPTQTSLEQTQTNVIKARELIRNHPEVVDVHWFMGKSAPQFYYNVIANRENSANYAQGLVQLQPNVVSRPLIQSLQSELNQAFPAAQVLVRQIEQGPPFDAPIELRLYGPQLHRLRELGNQIRAELAQVPDVIHTRADLTEGLPKLALTIDEEQARLAGIDKTEIAQQLDTSLEGAVGGSVLEVTEELPVRVRLSNPNRSNLNQIASLNLLPNSNTGDNRERIPLSALGDIKLIPDLATISRRNGQRVNTVQGFITAGVLPATVLDNFKQRLSTLELPSGYSYDFGGEADERSSAVSNLVSTLGVLMILMAATLILTFGSFRLAGIIGLIAVFSVGLALGSLWLFGYPFGFTAILGTIGLLGVVVNDSIVVLTALHQNPRVREGNRQATRDVVIHSTRHVIATTITTMIGFSPLLLEKSGFWPPLAIVIIGGLGGATLMALSFVPCAYLLLKRKKHKRTYTSRPLLKAQTFN
ncbi:efflux RND transporter permease subunit [Moorena producens JHB]|uniref:Efflux RND transporter permease subunit n=1 Tax=Moorena producens (strain JHB) TaxID=1454205 RepID=A0A1D9FZD4_MOOP1|nr:efflux RND transporter permease subunit [Moorena producens]AOY80742.1 efflux RND transporter permease subunit [Moorena producens JHB]